jgi:hypothetical protein
MEVVSWHDRPPLVIKEELRRRGDAPQLLAIRGRVDYFRFVLIARWLNSNHRKISHSAFALWPCNSRDVLRAAFMTLARDFDEVAVPQDGIFIREPARSRRQYGVGAQVTGVVGISNILALIQ